MKNIKCHFYYETEDRKLLVGTANLDIGGGPKPTAFICRISPYEHFKGFWDVEITYSDVYQTWTRSYATNKRLVTKKEVLDCLKNHAEEEEP